MITDLEYNSFELMAAAGARELKDGEIVCVGLGLPIVSSFLAKRTHAPNITILLELGDERLGRLAVRARREHKRRHHHLAAIAGKQSLLARRHENREFLARPWNRSGRLERQTGG